MKRQSLTLPQPEADVSDPFRVLLDESVPVSVAALLRRLNYEAILHGDVLFQGADDALVAKTALLNHAILIAIDKDMKRIAGRYGMADQKFQKLHLIKLGCPEPMAASRIEQALDLILLEWSYCCEKPSRRLYIEIGPHWIRTFR
ncbi:DUF5615 family PIN-like protein [Methylobacterium hispanicum]|uniref:DUF5615 family PIN-like protein n=1 Tax=Methylobacterium TaxID=407 RepID=UPI0012E3AD77|nr:MULTISPECIES: DUF5615 family PIN-like protein [Methylobacterium]